MVVKFKNGVYLSYFEEEKKRCVHTCSIVFSMSSLADAKEKHRDINNVNTAMIL